MAVITRADGQVIAWGGEVEGQAVYSEMGVPKTVTAYSAQLGVGEIELRRITVFVTELTKMAIGPSTSQREDVVKKCVVRYIENHCANKWIPQDNEHFTIGDFEISQLREEVLKAA
jgi:hypothetical protein